MKPKSLLNDETRKENSIYKKKQQAKTCVNLGQLNKFMTWVIRSQ
jgi:hypothetical protein